MITASSFIFNFSQMKRLLIRVFLILFFFIILFIGLKSVLPFYWGNVQVTKKLKCLSDGQLKPNTLFIGNSKIYHHIIPSVFDSIVNDGTVSFNIASDAAPLVESYALIMGLIDATDVKRIIIPRCEYEGIYDKFINTTRADYFWNYDLLNMVLDAFSSNTTELKRHYGLALRSFGFFGKGKNLLSLMMPLPYQETLCDNRGFFGLNRGRRKYPDGFNEWHRKFKKGKNRHYKLSKPDTENNATKVLFDDLIKYCEAHGVELYTIYNPNNYSFYFSSYDKAIYMGDGGDFKDYYTKEYWYDDMHLNEDGAVIFTKRLAEIFSSIK